MVNPCGHIGFGLIFAQIVKSVFNIQGFTFDAVAIDFITIAFSLLPDAIDKPLYWMKLQKSTRSFGHTLLFAIFVTFSFSYVCYLSLQVVKYDEKFQLEMQELCMKEEWRFHIFIAILSHLLSDLLFGYVPIFWPFQAFKFPSMIHTKTSKRIIFLIEIASIVYVYLFKPNLIIKIV